MWCREPRAIALRPPAVDIEALSPACHAQAYEELVQCVLRAAATGELKKKRHHFGQRQALFGGEVAGLGMTESLRLESLGESIQYHAEKDVLGVWLKRLLGKGL